MTMFLFCQKDTSQSPCFTIYSENRHEVGQILQQILHSPFNPSLLFVVKSTNLGWLISPRPGDRLIHSQLLVILQALVRLPEAMHVLLHRSGHDLRRIPTETDPTIRNSFVIFLRLSEPYYIS